MLVQAVHGTTEQSGVSADEVAGIGVDTTAATVLALVNKSDRYLRPAIMWMDLRAPGQAARLQLRRQVADELDLEPDTPVAEGGIDGFVGQIGLGVVEPGKLALTAGSSHALLGQVAEPVHGQGFWGAYIDVVTVQRETPSRTARAAETGVGLPPWSSRRRRRDV